MTTPTGKANRLQHEKSPYLLQHAANPVEWYPWGEEAFARARAENKPIFLSVGYSTCHWCHVMAHESFEDESIAHILNSHFISIKLDREERPDVDRIYMAALQAMGQNGGWPMSVFLTPDRQPFYGGTYFPPVSRHGRAGFPDILERIHTVWESDHGNVLESARKLTGFLQDIAEGHPPGALNADEVIESCFGQFSSMYDHAFGGFGGGPKFPRPVVLNFLLRYHDRTKNPVALAMVETTLQKMAVGGIADHIGGGFHRYSVDGEWRVPHFEKMLYDQAQLVITFVDAYRLTGNPFYSAVAGETIDYVLRDLRDSAGGFYSAEDADSPHPEDPGESGEGSFYLWTQREVRSLLGEQADLFCYYYGIAEEGNAPFDPQQEFTGRNILYGAHSVVDTAKKFGKDPDAVRLTLLQGRRRLLEARNRRPRPHRDEKILAGWNGLMISALASASSGLQHKEYLAAAAQAGEFVWRQLFIEDSRELRRRYREGDARFEACLDDYAFLTQGFLDLFEASQESVWLSRAINLMEAQIKRFKDDRAGGFFETTGADSSLLVRLKEQHDGAEPSGNSVSAMNLLRLSQILQRDDWRKLAEETVGAFSEMLRAHPVALPNMISAVDMLARSATQIILAGSVVSDTTRAMLRESGMRYLPNAIVLVVDEASEEGSVRSMVPWADQYRAADGATTAFVCRNYHCSLPTSDPGVFAGLLDGGKSAEA
jgi:hypothetical protein